MGEVYEGKPKQNCNQPHLKKMPWPYIPRLANKCIFAGLNSK